MKDYEASFRISTAAGHEIALMHMSRFTAAIVGLLLDEWKELNIDCLNYLGDGEPASWRVAVDDDLELPMWQRRPTYEAEERAGAIRARRARGETSGACGDAATSVASWEARKRSLQTAPEVREQ